VEEGKHPRGFEGLQCLCKNEGRWESNTFFASYPHGSRVKRAGQAGGSTSGTIKPGLRSVVCEDANNPTVDIVA